MIAYFVRHPVAANLLMALLCIMGLSVLSSLQRETFPDFESDSLAISVAYPGASARDVDEEICTPIEDALSGITGLADLECLSIEGRGSATAELEEGGDLSQFYNDVASAMAGSGDFPTDAEAPVVQIATPTDLVALIAVSGLSTKQALVNYSDGLADQLLRLPGVASASVSGITDREISISFDQEALRRYGLSASTLIDRIAANSLRLPLGNADLASGSIALRYDDISRSVAELQDLVVQETAEGAVLRLADLARVRLVDSDENSQSFIDGRQAAIIAVSKSRDADSIRVFAEVDTVLEAERAAYPAPFDITVINNITEVVSERLDLILRNIAMGLALVFGTMWLFFSLRDALWISAALPVSFLGALFVMSALGISLNMITLVALLMAVGLIMDDSIVIAENIDRWRGRLPAKEAAARGAAEVMPGVVSSFLTTACVFGPLMFLNGQMGQILKYIPMVLLIVLTLSLVEGFLMLPNHLSHEARPRRRSRDGHGTPAPAAGAGALARLLRALVVLPTRHKRNSSSARAQMPAPQAATPDARATDMPPALLPGTLSHVAPRAPMNDTAPPRAAERLLERFKSHYILPAAATLLRLRYLTFGTVIAGFLLAIALVASGQVRVIGFPATESDTIQLRLALTSGIDRSRTVATVDRLLAALDRVDAELTPATQGGAPLVERVLLRYGVNSEVSDNGAHTATITVDLLDSSRRGVSADAVLARWREAAGPLPDVNQISFAQNEVGPGGMDLDVELRGHDLALLEAAASDLQMTLVRREDVSEAYSSFYGGRAELRIRLTAYGHALGLTPQDLSAQLRNAFQGSETDSFREEASTLTIRVRLARDAVRNLTTLEQFPILLPGGAVTTLARVAELTRAASYPVIQRKNGMAVARVQGRIDRSLTTSGEISALVMTQIAPPLTARYPGVTLAIGGATEEQQKSQASMLRALLLGLVGVYMVLAFQFRSYLLPLVVMLSIPFALIGTILGHWALGLNLSMPSFIGFASLAGIVVNNAILFLTFFQTHLRDGNYEAAALDAVRARFRPVLLSTSTTFVGLIPIITEGSPQVQTLVPLVVSVAFGLLASMVLVVLVFPAVLAIYFDLRSVERWSARFPAPAETADRADPEAS